MVSMGRRADFQTAINLAVENGCTVKEDEEAGTIEVFSPHDEVVMWAMDKGGDYWIVNYNDEFWAKEE